MDGVNFPPVVLALVATLVSGCASSHPDPVGVARSHVEPNGSSHTAGGIPQPIAKANGKPAAAT